MEAEQGGAMLAAVWGEVARREGRATPPAPVLGRPHRRGYGKGTKFVIVIHL